METVVVSLPMLAAEFRSIPLAVEELAVSAEDE